MFLWTGKMYLHIAQFEDNLPLFALFNVFAGNERSVWNTLRRRTFALVS